VFRCPHSLSACERRGFRVEGRDREGLIEREREREREGEGEDREGLEPPLELEGVERLVGGLLGNQQHILP